MVVNVGSTYGSIGYAGYAAIARRSLPCAGSPKRCVESWPTPGSACSTSHPRATRTSDEQPVTAQALNDALKANVDDPRTVALGGDPRDSR